MCSVEVDEAASTSHWNWKNQGADKRITTKMGEESTKVDVEYVPDPAMKAEIEAAVGFLTDFLVKAPKQGFSQESVDLFRRSLQSLLYRHFNGHWNSANPLKGSGFRCLRINGMLDPLVKKAAESSRLPLRKVRQAFPAELTVWVDPGDVSVRFGEEGSVGVWYASRRAGEEDEKLKEHLANHHQSYQHRVSPARSSTPPTGYHPHHQAYHHAHQRVSSYQHQQSSPVQYRHGQQSTTSVPVWIPQQMAPQPQYQRASPSWGGFATALSHQQQQMQRSHTPLSTSNSPSWRSSPQPNESMASSTPPTTTTGETGEEQRCKMLAERLMRENLNLMASLAPGLVSSRAQPVGVGVN